MADTVVSYILNVNTQNAQKNLDKTGNEAKQTSHQFEELTKDTERLAQSTDRLNRSQKQAAFSARSFRRAGRDLDGAFGDLAQGLNLVNPQLGTMFQTLSDGASIAEGLGRGLMGVMSPAFLVVAGAAAALGTAMYFVHKQQEEARVRSENLAKVIAETNKTIEEQEKVLQKTSQAFADYIQDVNNTGNQLALLTGSISQYDYESAKATATAEEFRKQSYNTYQEEQAALKESIGARSEQISQLKTQLKYLEDQRKVEGKTLDRYGNIVKTVSLMSEEEKLLRQQLDSQQNLLDSEKDKIEQSKENLALTRQQADQIEKNLEQIALLKEQDRQRSEQEKRNAKYRSEQAKKQAELEKQIAKEQREQEQRRQQALNAQNALENLIYSTTLSMSTERQKINMNLEKQLENLQALKDQGANTESILQAEKLLREQAIQQIEELEKREKKITDEKNKQLKEEQEKTKEKEKQARLDKISSGVAAGATLATGDIGSMLGLISPIAGQIATTLMKIGEKTPAERRQELLDQVEALKLGLSFLPEIFLSVLPQVALALTEAIIDGIQLFFENLVELLKNLFTGDRRSRDERRSQRRSFISDFFDPDKSATFQGGGRFLASAMGGIRYTGEARQGLAMLHQGEYVVPRTGQAPQQVQRDLSSTGSGININISSIITDQNAIDKLVREIENRFNSRFGVSQSNLFGGR